MLTFYPSRIPDSGVKKAPDPGSRYATLSNLMVYLLCIEEEPVVEEGQLGVARRHGVRAGRQEPPCTHQQHQSADEI
jgi:hypothetical protein